MTTPNEQYYAGVPEGAPEAYGQGAPVQGAAFAYDAQASPTDAPGQPGSAPFIPAPDQPLIVGKPHHSYIWLGSARMTVRVIIALFITFLATGVGMIVGSDNAAGEEGLYVGIVLAIIVAVFVISIVGTVISYRYIHYELSAEEFSLYSGFLSKKRVHVPYSRIQSVDQKASLLQRIFGVCSLWIDTAGGANNKAIVVPYLQKEQAELLRAQLFAFKSQKVNAASLAAAIASGAVPASAAAAAMPTQVAYPGASVPGAAVAPTAGAYPVAVSGPYPGAPYPTDTSGNLLDIGAQAWDDFGGLFAGTGFEEGNVSYETGLSNKELIFTALSNNGSFAVIILAILSAVGQFASNISLFTGSDEAISHIAELSWRIFGPRMMVGAVLALLGVAAAMWLVAAAATAISYGGFRARRRGSRIEVERGLLQHVHLSIDIDRVQTIQIRQGFVRRLMGYASITLGRVENTSDENQKQSGQTKTGQGLCIHPFVKIDKVPQVIAGLAPELADMPLELEGLPRVALRRAIIRNGVLYGFGFWLALIVALIQIMVNLAWGSASVDLGLAVFNRCAIVVYGFCLVFFALQVVSAVLWYKQSGWAVSERFATFRNGGWSVETISIPRSKIQNGSTRTNPFQAAAGTTMLIARTAAASAPQVRLMDASAEGGERWLAWMEPRV